MALPDPSSKEDQNSKSSEQEDKDFDPSAEALIDEIDDERTLEEEEALAADSGAKVQEELDELKRESDMPIEELLAYYERMRNEVQDNQVCDEDEEEYEDEEEEEEADDENESEAGKKKPDTQSGSVKSPTNSSTPLEQQQHQSEIEHGCNQSSKSEPQHQSPLPKSKHMPSCGIMDSDAHSTTTSTMNHTTSEQVQQRKQNQAASLDQAETSQLRGDANQESGSSIVQRRQKHSMTNFIIDDESGGIFKTLLDYDLDDSDDMDEDYSYTDDENGDDERDWRRSIHIGSDYQADVPLGLSEYDDLPPYENDDKLIWRWHPEVSQERVLDYLKQSSMMSRRNDISTCPASVPKISNDSTRMYRERMQDITSSTGSHVMEQNYEIVTSENPPRNLLDAYISQSRKRARIDYELEQENAMDSINQLQSASQTHLAQLNKEENSDSASQDPRAELSTDEYFQDEEQLLFLLLQCNHNVEEALRRRKLDPFKYYFNEPMSLWSQDECLGFEHGLRVYGKNFRLIRQNKVQTRTHAELVAFYYLWKKSERHDVYTNQYKLDRKRCLSHPGTTDYMDKFIEDNESILNASSSSTPTPTEGNVLAHPQIDSTNNTNSSTPLLLSHAYQPCKVNSDNNPPHRLDSTSFGEEREVIQLNKD